jgi:adenosylcobinamide-phosphate synthase
MPSQKLSARLSIAARIVGRDVAALDTAAVARAAIESLAESFCDGIVAPLFWLLLLGLPGLWIYKAVNTADSMIGHREPRWGALLCVVGGGGWRVMRRDARRHASPNAGWTEAAMAGALGLSLAGPVWYDHVRADKPWIGDGRRTADAHDITRALRLYRAACLALWAIAGVFAWLR